MNKVLYNKNNNLTATHMTCCNQHAFLLCRKEQLWHFESFFLIFFLFCGGKSWVEWAKKDDEKIFMFFLKQRSAGNEIRLDWSNLDMWMGDFCHSVPDKHAFKCT